MISIVVSHCKDVADSNQTLLFPNIHIVVHSCEWLIPEWICLKKWIVLVTQHTMTCHIIIPIPPGPVITMTSDKGLSKGEEIRVGVDAEDTWSYSRCADLKTAARSNSISCSRPKIALGNWNTELISCSAKGKKSNDYKGFKVGHTHEHLSHVQD